LVFMKRWNYKVLQIVNENKYIISVCFCEQIIDYSLHYWLKEEEVKLGFRNLSGLAESIRQDREKYKDRLVSQPTNLLPFNRDEVESEDF